MTAAANSLAQLTRVAVAWHRRAFAMAWLTVVAGGLFLESQLPPRYAVAMDVYVQEPVAVHRLANPFGPVPRDGHGLPELAELLRSRQTAVSLVKSTALVDRWALDRSPLLRLKDGLLELVRGGPFPEDELVDSLATMVERRTTVTVRGEHVLLTVEWSSPGVALDLARELLHILTHQPRRREVDALTEAGLALDEQAAGVRAEIDGRVRELDRELNRPDRAERPAQLEARRERLFRDQLRLTELEVQADEKLLGAEVMRRSNAHRFFVVQGPEPPRRPLGPPAGRWLLTVALVGLLGAAGAVGVLVLGGGALVSDGQVRRLLGVPVVGTVAGPGLYPRPLPGRLAVAGAAALALATAASLGLSRGNVLVAVAPVVGAAGLRLVWTVPLRWPFLGLMLAAVCLDDPTDRPYAGLWQSPLTAAGRVLFTNIAYFTGFELAILGLAAALLARRVFRGEPLGTQGDAAAGQPRKLVHGFLALSLAAVVWLVALGLARGGDFREALWQFRALLFLPVMGALAMAVLEFPRDLRAVAGVLATGTVVKAVLGAYFIYRVAYPAGEFPPHTTGHNDTMIFVTAIVLAAARVWERATPGRLASSAALAGVAVVGIFLNDRRIAYVDLAACLGVMYLVSPWHPMKRAVTRLAVVLTPVVLVYVAAGWDTRGGTVFRPVQKIRSVIAPPEGTEEESSTAERGIENYNIIRSWYGHMAFGQGFGHAFTEFVPSNDFSQSRYGHIGHNSILWLMWIGGVTGYTAVLLYLAAAALLIRRSLDRTGVVAERVALLVSLGVLITFVLQAFGDMGLLSMQFNFFVATVLSVVTHLAGRRGALALPATPAVTARRAAAPAPRRPAAVPLR